MKLDPTTEARVLALATHIDGKPVQMPDTRPVAERVSEADFQAAVIELAKANGWKHFHVYNSRKSVAGWPDLVLVRGPTLLFMELKSHDGVVEADQQNWIEALTAAGQAVYIVRPRDWMQIEAMLK